MTNSDVATRRFYAWANRHPGEATDPFMAWQAAWQHGGRHALLCSSEIAELIPRLEAITNFFQIENEDIPQNGISHQDAAADDEGDLPF